MLIRDQLPGVHHLGAYEANQQRLAREPRPRRGHAGGPRTGPSLLAGLVRCGRCGRRMLVALHGPRSGRLRYSCQRGATGLRRAASARAWPGGPLDELVAGQVLAALEPAALELSLAAVGRRRAGAGPAGPALAAAAGAGRLRGRAGGPAVPGVRAGEPAGRRGSWSGGGRRRCRRSGSVEDEYDRFRRGRPAELTARRCDMIESLAGDIPALWRAATTTAHGPPGGRPAPGRAGGGRGPGRDASGST